jgi:murein DD-endopeptidase MepM/ murein hydrolase activator NlpD
MKRRFFTVLVLRHSGPRFRKVRVSYAFVGTAALVALTLTLAGLYAPRLLVRVQERSVAIDRLEHENDRLRGEREAFEGALSEMSDQLGSFEASASVLAKELGVGDLPSERAAAGGPGAELPARQRFWFDGEVRALQSRTNTLDRSFDQLGESFRERMDHLAATPNVMPVEGWFSHGFGWRKDPFSGKREFHRGIDIVAPANTKILAPADGVVSRAGRFPQLGKSLDMAHGFGYVTRYAHLNELLVRPGDRVSRGDVLGLVGSTGRSTGPHLHYEVFRDGRRVNPWNYLGHSGR